MKYSAGRILCASFFSHSRLRCYLKFAVLWVLLHSSLSGWPLDLVAGTEKGRSIGLSRSIWEDWLEWWPELWAARILSYFAPEGTGTCGKRVIPATIMQYRDSPAMSLHSAAACCSHICNFPFENLLLGYRG